MTTEEPDRSVRVNEGRQGMSTGVIVLISLMIGVSVAMLVDMEATARQGDGFTSPLYPWTWLILPLAAALASACLPSALNPLRFTAALIVPLIIWTFLSGTVLHDDSHGRSFWLVGELVNLLHGLLTLGAAYLGALLVHLLRRRQGTDEMVAAR